MDHCCTPKSAVPPAVYALSREVSRDPCSSSRQRFCQSDWPSFDLASTATPYFRPHVAEFPAFGAKLSRLALASRLLKKSLRLRNEECKRDFLRLDAAHVRSFGVKSGRCSLALHVAGRASPLSHRDLRTLTNPGAETPEPMLFNAEFVRPYIPTT